MPRHSHAVDEAQSAIRSWLTEWLPGNEDDLIAIRRDLHAHPELGNAEKRTTDVIVRHLKERGLSPAVLPGGTGVVCDVAPGDQPGPIVALRADIDALLVDDLKDVPYRSQNKGICHACGHDVHTTILLGAASAFAEMATLPGRVRLIFQPAEEQLPGGAVATLGSGVLDDVREIYALHCDPRLEVGMVGTRVGPITAASDTVEVHLAGPGGHTARPHLTVDLVYALGRVITELPGMLARRVDPRVSASLVWGAAEAGRAANAIPATGVLRGTVRVLDRNAWAEMEPLIRSLVDEIVAPTGAKAETIYVRGVPPVVNDPACTDVQDRAVAAGLSADALTVTPQSMGGEDFAWYLERIPGSLARLGVRPPEVAPYDLHQGTFDVDESAIGVGVRMMVHTVVEALAR